MNKEIIVMTIILLSLSVGCKNRNIVKNKVTTEIITETVTEIATEKLIEPIVEEKNHNKISGKYYFFSGPIETFNGYTYGVNYIIVTDNSVKVSGYYILEEKNHSDVYGFMENEFILNDETIYYYYAEGEHPASKSYFKNHIEFSSNTKYYGLDCVLTIKDGIVLKAGVHS